MTIQATTYGSIDIHAILLANPTAQLLRIRFEGQPDLVFFQRGSEVCNAISHINAIDHTHCHNSVNFDVADGAFYFSQHRDYYLPGEWRAVTHPDAVALITKQIAIDRATHVPEVDVLI